MAGEIVTELPEGWVTSPLSEFLQCLESGCRPKGGVKGITCGVPSIGGEHLVYSGFFDFSSIRYVPAEFAKKMTKGHIKKNDILIVKDGATTGKTVFVGNDFPFSEAVVNEHVFICRLFDRIEPRFVFRFLSSKEGQEKILANFQGSAQGGINLSFAPNTEIPLAPLLEQRRIVAKLEKLLGKVDACEKRLAKIPIILKRFRQSVLASACSGRLTTDWREKNTLPLAPSPQGRGKKRDNSQPPTPQGWMKNGDTSQAPSPLEGEGEDLPEGWTATILKDVADMRLGKMLDRSKNLGEPTPYLRNINVRWFTFDLSGITLMRATADDKRELAIKNGDLLVCEGGEPGRCAVWNLGENLMIFQKAIHRIRPVGNVSPHWLAFNLCNDANSGRLAEYFTGTTIKHLTGKSLATYGIPLPPLLEQQEIVRRVEALFALADQIEARYMKAKAYVDKLTQSILAKAFRGELVPQDPSDEPASVLLERIRREKVAASVKVTNIEKKRGKKYHVKEPVTLPMVAEKQHEYGSRRKQRA